MLVRTNLIIFSVCSLVLGFCFIVDKIDDPA